MSEERRVVTILFADVTGSTAMGESNDPEDVRALLGRYYAIAREVVAAHGGTLEKRRRGPNYLQRHQPLRKRHPLRRL